MHKVVLISLRGYREWTESLGPRREHIIQKVQARIHGALWSSFTAVGALPHHFRYDYLIALANNVPRHWIDAAVAKIRRSTPVEVDYCIGMGETPLDAYRSCGEHKEGKESNAVVAHVDIVNSTDATRINGPIHTYLRALDMLRTAAGACEDVGCIAFYLGGDNMVVYLPEPKAIYALLDRVEAPVRAGVGVSPRPYTAFVKATKGLDALRAENKTGVKVVR
ncbi:GTP cyclohydrolase IIa [Pyrobaculum sp.]|uniref:GTP cyclohydrolase IIa n=1 Tax=Pyrobaculum sp. TaxID=2004705 RepID=UPI00316C2E84